MWRLVALPVTGGLELHDSLGPFQPRPFCDCVVQCHGSISSFPGTTRRPDSLKASCLLSSIILPAKIVYQNWLLADITYSSFFFSTEKEVQCDPCWADSQVSFLTASHNSNHEAGLHKENTADNIWQYICSLGHHYIHPYRQHYPTPFHLSPADSFSAFAPVFSLLRILTPLALTEWKKMW